MKNILTGKGVLMCALYVLTCGFCSAQTWERVIPSVGGIEPFRRDCVFSPRVKTFFLTGEFSVSEKKIYLINENGIVSDSIQRSVDSYIFGLTFTNDSTSILISGIDVLTAELFISQYTLSGSLVRERRLYTPDDWHYPISLCHSENGYVYVTGFHRVPSESDFRNMLIFKMDTLGNIYDFRVYYHPFTNYCVAIKTTFDGNLIIAGRYNNSPWLVKADTNCDTIWTRTYPYSAFHDIKDIAVTSDGGYILAASSIVRLDSLGNILWTFDTTASTGYPLSFHSVFEKEGGSIVFSGIGIRGMLNSEGELRWTNLDSSIVIVKEWRSIDVYNHIFSYSKGTWMGESLTHYLLTDSLGFVVNHNYRIKRGWNLISSPVEEELWVMGSFPYVRASDCHYYNPREYRYYNSYGITHGRGYWLFSTVDSTTHIEATIGTIPDLNATLYPGWNLVGTGTIPIPAEWLDTIPSVVMPVFGFDPDSGGYYAADTLYYGNGYWILSRDSTEVVLP